MGGDNVQRLWYSLCLIKAVVTFFVVFVVVLLCKWLLRYIPWNRVKRRSVKHKIVHFVGILQPPRNFDASESKAVYRGRNERKERIG
jgi:hypothetical protein